VLDPIFQSHSVRDDLLFFQIAEPQKCWGGQDKTSAQAGCV
jgi:hypothetical protein